MPTTSPFGARLNDATSRLLVAATITYNVIEAIVAITAGATAAGAGPGGRAAGANGHGPAHPGRRSGAYGAGGDAARHFLPCVRPAGLRRGDHRVRPHLRRTGQPADPRGVLGLKPLPRIRALRCRSNRSTPLGARGVLTRPPGTWATIRDLRGQPHRAGKIICGGPAGADVGTGGGGSRGGRGPVLGALGRRVTGALSGLLRTMVTHGRASPCTALFKVGAGSPRSR